MPYAFYKFTYLPSNFIACPFKKVVWKNISLDVTSSSDLIILN